MELTLAPDRPVALADLGGTNCRFALWQPGTSTRDLRVVVRCRNDDFPDLESMIAAYLERLPGEKPVDAVVAVAAPIIGDEIDMSNRDWRFSTASVTSKTSLDSVTFINDFEAQALAIPSLTDSERRTIGPDRTPAGQNAAILGPGTGLGVAGLIETHNPPLAITGEGGHMTLGANNRDEDRLVAAVRERHGHCSGERVLSGMGIELLHELMHGTPGLKARDISAAALAGDADARQTFEQFFAFLGAVAADVALCLGATRGVYITGGVAFENALLLAQSPFRERFLAKGRYTEYLDRIPTYLITADTPALFGLAQYAAGRSEQQQ
ncbi:MAG: glucokinase [Pseudomonadota bacterium]